MDKEFQEAIEKICKIAVDSFCEIYERMKEEIVDFSDSLKEENAPMQEQLPKEIRCSCGKLLAKITKDGIIKVWCKLCHKEVELEVEPYEPSKNQTTSV